MPSSPRKIQRRRGGCVRRRLPAAPPRRALRFHHVAFSTRPGLRCDAAGLGETDGAAMVLHYCFFHQPERPVMVSSFRPDAAEPEAHEGAHFGYMWPLASKTARGRARHSERNVSNTIDVAKRRLSRGWYVLVLLVSPDLALRLPPLQARPSPSSLPSKHARNHAQEVYPHVSGRQQVQYD